MKDVYELYDHDNIFVCDVVKPKKDSMKKKSWCKYKYFISCKEIIMMLIYSSLSKQPMNMVKYANYRLKNN